jgi:poly-gamma-glutamate capsule biosynthesis protein CapA/YwtB (metallophosphatase superfamily)
VLRRALPVLSISAALLAAASPSGGQRAGRSFTLAASGDILVHQAIAAAAAGYAPASGGYDFRPLLRPIEPWIADADFAICHLEGTLSPTNTGLLYQEEDEHPAYFNAPREVAAALAATGYDACSTAGNHALDRGLAGVRETLEVLDAAGVGHAGTARSQEERLPTLYRVNGVRVAHLAYTIGTNEPRPYDARWAVNLIDAEAILADARWAREHGAEFTVVSLHWGTEYTSAPDGLQLRLAEALTASPDVDLILGHHAHVVQPLTLVNGKVVAYGLGDHLSNIQPTADGPKYGAGDGVIVQLTVAEQETGRFAVTAVAVTPTLVYPPTKQVLSVEHTLASGADGAFAAALQASAARTLGTLGRLDPAPAVLSAQPWPSLVCRGHVATLAGTSEPDVLVGTFGDDVIVGRGGNDTILALEGDDLICGGDGDDSLWGGAGRDELWGGAGGDDLYGAGGPDRLYGELGIDTIWGGGDDDTLDGGPGNDRLLGHEGADLLLGGPGTNYLWGGTGADTLVGYTTADVLAGDDTDACLAGGVLVRCRG